MCNRVSDIVCYVCRECSQAACQLLATESSNEGVLKDAEDIDEAAILAALEEYESAATR